MSKDRKYKYGEKTVLVSGFRVPISKVQDFKDSAYAKLDSYMNEGKTVSVLDQNSEMKKEKFINDFPIAEEAKKILSEKISSNKTGYEIVDRVPFGTSPIEIIGHKLHKDNDEEIYYIKLSEGKGFKVVVLHSEKEVKDFIRKEIVK